MDRNAFFSDTSEHHVTEWTQRACCTLWVRFHTTLADKLRVSSLLQEREETVSFPSVSGGSRFREYACTSVIGSPVPWLSLIGDGESGEKFYYDRRGASAVARIELYFQHIPGSQAPDWTKGVVMYQIFMDCFRDDDLTNVAETDEYLYIGPPVQHIENWDEKPPVFDVGYFYGGDPADVREKFMYLKNLDVEVAYFNLFFVSPSNYRYDTQDHDHINPHFTTIVKDSSKLLAPDAGDNLNVTRYQKRSADRKNPEASDRFFTEFVVEVHHSDFRILLDDVFNHCGLLHKWLGREKIHAHEGGYASGAHLTPDSLYRRYFVFVGNRPEA